MSLKVTFEISDADLRHFKRTMRDAREAAREKGQAHIVTSARRLMEQTARTDVPAFVEQRLRKLRLLCDMLEDEQWGMPALERNRVLSALAYFAEPEDMIPDHIPGLGFLDDAIMVELVVRELRHEIDAYTDFIDFRRREGIAATLPCSDGDRLAGKRSALHERMRRRSRSDRRDGRARGGARLTIF